ncbi:GNAT family N-acetyltransferase [Streptomyces sp. LHD-70]|uniref:GNAT family N-acetyltransferase n=1 Tax=Streptomyces sp. LHD-70 TaxID=3072140 RepID=UPI00280C6939|nr:GNAT family N-acetyltransferase [Streptomyces sp. LHD-70]MDQ8705019.1 GNAT family N-acetyltransferase [Streptomyces sp. LHD-70]
MSDDTQRDAPRPDIRDNRPHGRLEARTADGRDGQLVGRIDYFTLDATPAAPTVPALVAVHTVVEPDHEGQGIAGALARELYALAAREGAAVVPLCPYVAGWAERHPDEAPAPPEALTAEAKKRLAADPGLW